MAINKKTGKRYQIVGIAINANNGEECSEPVVVYESMSVIYCRKITEFTAKFQMESEIEHNLIAEAERDEL